MQSPDVYFDSSIDSTYSAIILLCTGDEAFKTTSQMIAAAKYSGGDDDAAVVLRAKEGRIDVVRELFRH